MTKFIATKEARRAPVIVMTTTDIRRQVEQVARRDGVSLSEVGRQALQEYLKRRGEETGDE